MDRDIVFSSNYSRLNPNCAPHSGNWAAWLGGYTSASDELYQDFRVPLGATSVDVSFYVAITTTETAPYEYDHFYAVLDDDQGQEIQELIHLSNIDEALVWYHVSGSIHLSSQAGQFVRLRFLATGDSQQKTDFVLDDVSFVMHCGDGEVSSYGITVTAVSAADPIESVVTKDNP